MHFVHSMPQRLINCNYAIFCQKNLFFFNNSASASAATAATAATAAVVLASSTIR